MSENISAGDVLPSPGKILGAAIGAGELIETWLHAGGFITILRESQVIGGWVAMWRPIEVFLYDWWPIRAEACLYDRLAAMPVRIQYATDEKSDAWRDDWPVAHGGNTTRRT